MSDTTDVAIVGAGPYGLSVAAHLRAAGVPFRQFGLPMQWWRASMPKGMLLKSQGFASNLSSPEPGHTLKDFCAAAALAYANHCQPIPLDTFCAYGLWFARRQAPDVEQTLVRRLARADGGFELELADGRLARARNVVVATGVGHFAAVPEQLAELPAAVCTHSSAHGDLAAFSGRAVVVLGAGQSAVETAALLHEQGAAVRLVARARQIAWNLPHRPPERWPAQRLRAPVAGIGTGWGAWLYSTQPGLFRLLPESVRAHKARTVLGPAAASWLADRVNGKFPVLLGHRLTWAKTDGDRVRLGFDGPEGGPAELAADHVVAATGYRTDLARLPFLTGELRAALRAVGDAPAVNRHHQSCVPGLYFAGPMVATSFGPVMRFVYGADAAARAIASRLAGRR